MPLAIRAITGAAPVPVPPPSVAAIKTMSVFLSRASICGVAASAACLPRATSPPVLSPWVTVSPICRRTGARVPLSSLSDVLMEIKSTPTMPDSIIRLTALEPPPPTPITLIR